MIDNLCNEMDIHGWISSMKDGINYMSCCMKILVFTIYTRIYINDLCWDWLLHVVLQCNLLFGQQQRERRGWVGGCGEQSINRGESKPPAWPMSNREEQVRSHLLHFSLADNSWAVLCCAMLGQNHFAEPTKPAWFNFSLFNSNVQVHMLSEHCWGCLAVFLHIHK
jgi:hypothetical protein